MRHWLRWWVCKYDRELNIHIGKGPAKIRVYLPWVKRPVTGPLWGQEEML